MKQIKEESELSRLPIGRTWGTVCCSAKSRNELGVSMESVLVIDDDVLMLDVMREMLELDGYEAFTASSGEEGIRVYREKRPDLVITDLIMPHTDGVALISELKREFPKARIIAMSGTPRIEKIAEAVEADVNRVIAKPFEQDELLDAVAELMAGVAISPS